MSFERTVRRWQQWILIAALVLSSILMWPNAVEPFMVVKATAIHAAAVALLGLWAAKAVWRRELLIPMSAAPLAGLTFLVAAAVVTATSTSVWTSLIGVTGRSTGLISYASYVVVFLTTVAVWDEAFARLLRRSASVSLGAVVIYGLAQAVGLDPVSYRDDVSSTMGNIDFAAAWCGAVAALATSTLLSRTESRRWRLAAAILLPLALLYTVLTTTSQGIVVALVSVGWTAAITALYPGGWLHGRARIAIAAAAGVTGIGLLTVWLGWSLLRAQLVQAMVERPDFWVAAWRIFEDHPALGTGLDTYGHYFLQYRPASHAVAYGVIHADAPHSVPLSMLANGGVVLFLSHVGFVATIGFLLLRAASRGSGEVAVLAGFGGVWVGYQAQALISYDVPPLALLHWLSAAAVVAVAATPRYKTVSLPGSAPRAAKIRGREVGPLAVPTTTRVLHGAVALGTVGALWFALNPLRADLTAAHAASIGGTGSLDLAARRLEDAAALNPAEGIYLFQAARAREAAGQPLQSASLAVAAARRDPGAVQYWLLAARQALAVGDLDLASGAYEHAVRTDPRHPAVLIEVASFFATHNDLERAERLAQRAHDLDPSSISAQDLLRDLAARS